MAATAALRKRLAELDREELSLLQAQRGPKTLREFMAWLAPHEPPPRHLEPLIDLLEQAKRKQIRVCVSMPPRHGKTITIQKALAWWLYCTPRDTCAYVSYSERQAHSKAEIARELASRAGVKIGGLDTKSEWRTERGGGMLVAGAGAGITGQGVQGVMVFDDPYKEREEAESVVLREKIWDRFSDVVLTRDEGNSVIVCHTRWVQDDLIGRLVRDHGWPWLNFAAIAGPGDPLGRAPGEALWPEAHPLSKLEMVRGINAYTFASLYQGEPRPRGSTVFKAETYYDPDEFKIDGCRISFHIDTAGSAKTSADWSAMLVMAMRGQGEKTEGWVLDVFRAQMEIPDFVRTLRAWQTRLGNPLATIDGASGIDKAVAQVLRDIDPKLRIKECQPLGDKFTRAQPAATAWNGGRLRIPMPKPGRPVPWLKDFLSEVSVFTGVNDANDDQVDCLSGAWNQGYQASWGETSARGGPMVPRRI
jgi:predicted phage terminase large subunit-like protein